ncbi:carboxypeptidase-like regulatory domain-containing protein [Actinokineospora soli]|uniref:Carboxypeptidase-like regulatory domain-containing protein n=1 Tax=Actinokineospora soli TaxID=1048753 RepID=A0ABW2TYV9_9PSEU
MEPLPHLQYAVQFDKPSYKTGDRVVVTLTITNTGDADTVVHGREPHGPDHEPGFVYLDYESWGDLYLHDGDGVPLAAGASYTHELRGTVVDLDAAEAVFDVTLLADKHHTWDARATAPLERAEGALAGTTYLDRNGNRVVDAGEPVAGAKVTVSHPYGEFTRVAVSDAQGRYDFPGLAPVRHFIRVDALDGWEFEGPGVDIAEGETAEVDLAGVRPFKESLTAQVEFTMEEYQPGDTAEVLVTLANTGDVRLAGITAHCNGAGTDEHLVDIQWGDLAYGGPGIAIQPGRTYRARVPGTVPEAARRHGVATVACAFGLESSTNNPIARTSRACPARRVRSPSSRTRTATATARSTRTSASAGST